MTMCMEVTREKAANSGVSEFATFYVGELLLGVEILQINEINRNCEITPVPQAPVYVRGVINMRGEVITVVDLRTILGLAGAQRSRHKLNVTVTWKGERVALLVDRISDVVRSRRDAIVEPPANLMGIGGRNFLGVLELDHELLVVLNIDEVLSYNAN